MRQFGDCCHGAGTRTPITGWTASTRSMFLRREYCLLTVDGQPCGWRVVERRERPDWTMSRRGSPGGQRTVDDLVCGASCTSTLPLQPRIVGPVLAPVQSPRPCVSSSQWLRDRCYLRPAYQRWRGQRLRPCVPPHIYTLPHGHLAVWRCGRCYC